MIMKKIAIVVNTSWNVFNFRYGLLNALHEQGNKIVVIAPRDEYSKRFEESGFEYHDIDINGSGTNPFEDLQLTYALYKAYKNIRPDVILHYTIKPNIYGTIAADLLHIPNINNIAGLGTLFVHYGFTTFVAKKLYRFAESRADHIFFQNRDDLQLFLDEKIVKREKCDVLPGSGIDISKFTPVEKRDDGVVRFLLIARMLREKGIEEYVEAAKIIKAAHDNVEFQLLGWLCPTSRYAVTQEQMDAWTEKGYVNYLGTTDNVREYIGRADCIVLPSYYREGTPRTLLESASMAKPIITTDNVGCRDVVDDGVNGYLCRPRDAADLAEKIAKFLEISIEERTAMGKNSREKMIREFDEKIVIKKYVEVIEQVGRPNATDSGNIRLAVAPVTAG